MGLLAAAIWGALLQLLGTLVGRVLVSLGIGYTIFSGVDVSIEFARDFVISKITSSSAQTVRAAGSMQIGTAISILTSALVTRLTLNGMTGGVVKRMGVK